MHLWLRHDSNFFALNFSAIARGLQKVCGQKNEDQIR
jgi:hypothetical protein